MSKKLLSKRLSEVIKTDAKNAHNADFLATHAPFDNLEYISSGRVEHSPSKMNESNFFREKILDNRYDHNFIVVKGAHGSGKSHFIRWLKEKYENEISNDEEVIFIERSQSTLKDALDQIKTNEFIQKFGGIDEIEKMINASQNLDEENLKGQLAIQLAHIAKNDKINESSLDEKFQKRIYDFLVDTVVQDYLSQKEGPLDRIHSRLVPDKTDKRKDDILPRFKAEDFDFEIFLLRDMQSKGSNRNAQKLVEELRNDRRNINLKEDLANFLNKRLDRATQNCLKLNSADLENVFNQLRIKLKEQNKMLTLFIEDITSFTGIDRGIVEVLITEHTSQSTKNFCRLFSVVGITNAYYNNELPDNIKDRVTGQVLLDGALFDDKSKKNKIVELAARYINALNLERETLENWVKNRGAVSSELPIADKHLNYSWSIYKLPEGHEVSLFPFNENALLNMFKYLESDQKTPREFLKSVIYPVIEAYINYSNFPPGPYELAQGKIKVPSFNPITHEKKVDEEADEEADRIKSLLLWWGNANYIKENNKLGGVSHEIFKSFGIDVLDLNGISKGEDSPVPPPSEPTTEPTSPTPPPTSKSNEEYNKLVKDLENWYKKGDKLRRYEDLRDNLIQFILDYIDWEFQDISPYLVNNNFNKNTVGIENQSGIIKSKKVYEVERNELSYYALNALLSWDYLGEKSWDFSESKDNLINLQIWIETNKSKIIESINRSSTFNDYNKIYSWNLAAKYYLEILCNNMDSTEMELFDLYNLILQKNNFDINEIKPEIHSKKFKEFYNKKIIKNSFSDKVEENNEIIIRFYNCHQGSISQSAITSVFVLDAEEILSRIERLENRDWNIYKLDFPSKNEVDAENESEIWFSGLFFIQLFSRYLETIVDAECKHFENVLNDFTKFFAQEYSANQINLLFDAMHDFLVKLNEVNEHYNTDDFRGLLHQHFNSDEFIRLFKNIEELLAIDKQNEQFICIFNNEILHKWQSYQKLLSNMKNLVEEVNKKYTQDKNDLSDGLYDIENIINEIKNILNELYNDLRRISGGENIVNQKD